MLFLIFGPWGADMGELCGSEESYGVNYGFADQADQFCEFSFLICLMPECPETHVEKTTQFKYTQRRYVALLAALL